MFIAIASRRACALLAVLLLPACTDKDDGATDTDAGTTDTAVTDAEPTDSDDNPPAAACECADSAPCSVPLCPEVFLNEDLNDSGGETDTNGDPALEEALTCALEALRDGKAGRIDARSSQNSGQFTEVLRLDLFGDGTARRTFGGAQDLCSYAPEDVSVAPLKAAQVFMDCLAEPDADSRFDCVLSATQTATTVCQMGVLDCSGI